MAALMSLSVSGCSRTHPSVEYERGANASAAFTHALLTLPPEFSLRPTVSEIEEHHDTTYDAREKRIGSADYSVGTAALLRAVGAAQILYSIRALIDHETDTGEEGPFIDQLVFLPVPDPRPEETTALSKEPIPLSVAPVVSPLSTDKPDTDPQEKEALYPPSALSPLTIRREEKRSGWIGLF